jgi:Uma2 family endonuclease
MAVAVSHPERGRLPAEQRLLLPNVPWKEYVLVRQVLDGPGLRMTYVEGALELMTPSPEHELWKTNVARLIELYAHIKRIDLRGYGSTTFKNEAKARGAEPGECYLVGKKLADYPEIVVEVIYSAPLLDKLDVYAAMRIPEVWIFRDGAFTIHRFDGEVGRYRPSPASTILPEVDLTLVARFATREDTPQALRELEALLR